MFNQGIGNQSAVPKIVTEDEDLAAWKRSSVMDEKIPQTTNSANRLNASMGGGSGSQQHSGTGLAGARGSGHSGTSQGQGVAKVHYITPNASGAAVTTVYTSPDSGAVVQPSTTVLVAYPPGQQMGQQQVTYIVVDNGGHNPLGVGAMSSVPNGSASGGDYSGNRYSSTAMAGSMSAHHGSGGLMLGHMGGSGSAFGMSAGGVGGSGTHMHTQAHVRTITIQPSSSHTLSDPSSSSGPGSTNDYYPVFVNQSDHPSGTDPGRSDTTDLSNGDRSAGILQQHLMHHISRGHSHLPVLLPDGTMVAPHAHTQAMSHPIVNQTILINAHTGLPLQGQDDALLRSVVGADSSGSTTTNVAVWGGSASAARQFAGGSSSLVPQPQQQQPILANPQIASQALHSNMYMMNSAVNGPSYMHGQGMVPSLPQQHQQLPPSHFIGGRGRGGGVQQPQQQVYISTGHPQQQAPPQFQSGGRGMTVGGRGRGAQAGGGMWVAPPKAAQPPSLGAAPTILVGKLPTPVFTQSVTIGGQKINTSTLVAPRFPAQGEEVVKVGGAVLPQPATVPTSGS
eukprot:GILI01022978.1.p1 GENE.GILI01022978.1~~GILI01022978.1.p1  ORF type:complete len:564 (+),score=78.43 GILI01022978.1:384-2075(+)